MPCRHNDTDTCECVIQVIPGTGWLIWYSAPKGLWSQPLFGWGLQCDGELRLLDTDRYGIVEEPTASESFVGIFPVGVTPPEDVVAAARKKLALPSTNS